MNDSRDSAPHESLRNTLRRAADQLAAEQPPPQVPAAVWAAMDLRQAQLAAAPRRAARPLAWAGGGLALASFALALVLLGTAPTMVDEAARRPATAATAFLPLVNADRWPQVLRETREQGPAWVVTTEIPRESLAAMGLPYDPSRAGEPVRAELLVQASGDVLAVRFVH
jgi:hypothetical protein